MLFNFFFFLLTDDVHVDEPDERRPLALSGHLALVDAGVVERRVRDAQDELLAAGRVERRHARVRHVRQVVQRVQLRDGERVAEPRHLEKTDKYK